MYNRREILSILLQHFNELEDPSFYEAFLTPDEECPFCDEAFNGIERGITLYREESIRIDVPDDVRFRLRRTIRKQWFKSSGQNFDDGV